MPVSPFNFSPQNPPKDGWVHQVDCDEWLEITFRVKWEDNTFALYFEKEDEPPVLIQKSSKPFTENSPVVLDGEIKGEFSVKYELYRIWVKVDRVLYIYVEFEYPKKTK